MPEGRNDTVDYKDEKNRNATSTLTNIKRHTHSDKNKKHTHMRRLFLKTKGLGKKEVSEQLGSHPVDLRDPPTDQRYLRDKSPCSMPKYLEDRSS